VLVTLYSEIKILICVVFVLQESHQGAAKGSQISLVLNLTENIIMTIVAGKVEH